MGRHLSSMYVAISVTLGLGVAIAIPSATKGDTDKSLSCIAPTGSWNSLKGTRPNAAAVDAFLHNIPPECLQLKEEARRYYQGAAARELDKSNEQEKSPTEVPKVEAAKSATPTPRRFHPPLDFTSGEEREWKLDYPNWYQVIDRYPQLAKLYERDSDDLCARCFIGKDGYLEDCEVAGQAAADPEVRTGAKLMMSMIRISYKDGRSAEGKHLGVPVRFGRTGAEPPGGYCRNKDTDFRP